MDKAAKTQPPAKLLALAIFELGNQQCNMDLPPG